MFKIDTNDYLHSICGIHGGLRKIPSPGKSGSTFYLSHNDRFLIKTVRNSEAKVLYCLHFQEIEDHLVMNHDISYQCVR